MADTKAEEFLSHTGVMGMHWGQRKDRTTSSSPSTRKAKPPSHRAQVNAAIDKKYGNVKTAGLDDRSSKTVRHGKIAFNSALLATGTFIAGHIARDSRVKTGLFALSIGSSAVSIVESAKENSSAGKDLIKKYGN